MLKRKKKKKKKTKLVTDLIAFLESDASAAHLLDDDDGDGSCFKLIQDSRRSIMLTAINSRGGCV